MPPHIAGPIYIIIYLNNMFFFGGFMQTLHFWSPSPLVTRAASKAEEELHQLPRIFLCLREGSWNGPSGKYSIYSLSILLELKL